MVALSCDTINEELIEGERTIKGFIDEKEDSKLILVASFPNLCCYHNEYSVGLNYLRSYNIQTKSPK